MKKNILKFIKRLIIFCLILILPITIYEIIMQNLDISYMWIDENTKINDMNTEKLKNGDWGENGVWLHNNEELTSKKEGIKRIFIVGDSFIWGNGYSNANHMWWKQFQHMLKEEGYTNVEVIAAGVSGYNTREQLNNILKDSSTMDIINPDFIIMTYVENDTEIHEVTRATFIETENFNVNAKISWINTLKKIYPASYLKISRLLVSKFFGNYEFEKTFGYNYNDWLELITNKESMKEYNEILSELNSLITNNFKVPYIYYMTVDEQKVDIIPTIKKAFNRNKIEHYCYFEIAKKYGYVLPTGENKINPQNYHPSVEYSQMYAKCLLKLLEEKYPDVLGQKNGVYDASFVINDWMPYNVLPNKISENIYELTYPKKQNSKSFLNLPVQKDYIKLNLEDPISLREICIESEQIENIKNATIWLNIINEELGYDDQVMREIKKEDNELIWQIDENIKITSINVNLELVSNEEVKFNLKVN